MKNLIYLLLVSSIISCKSKNSTITQGENTYTNFIEVQQTFKSIDGNINYIDKGEGEVILLLHGIPTSGWLYRKMIDRLVTEGYRVIVPDMLGFGSSDSPNGYELYSPQNHSKRLLALMNHLKIDTWNHVFHDVGGLWTWELFKLEPERIRKLVILNSIIYEAGFNPPMRFKKGSTTKLALSLYSNKLTNRMIMKKLFKNTLLKNSLTSVELEGYQRPLLEGKTNALYNFFSSTCHSLPDYKETLKTITIPTMVVWGKHDKVLQWESIAKDVVDDLKIKPNNIHIINGKHFIQEENTEELLSFMTEFFK